MARKHEAGMPLGQKLSTILDEAVWQIESYGNHSDRVRLHSAIEYHTPVDTMNGRALRSLGSAIRT